MTSGDSVRRQFDGRKDDGSRWHMQFTEKGVRWVRQPDRAVKASQLGKAALPDDLLPVLGLVAVAAIPIVLLLASIVHGGVSDACCR